MSDALKVSSDVYFYSLGLEARAEGDHGQIQDWARRFGLGQEPQSTCPNQGPGLIPTPAWRNRLFHKGTNPYIDRPWTAGDNVNLAIGQGDVQVTPLQLARAYAALANGGTPGDAAPRQANRGPRRAHGRRGSGPRPSAGSASPS